MQGIDEQTQFRRLQAAHFMRTQTIREKRDREKHNARYTQAFRAAFTALEARDYEEAALWCKRLKRKSFLWLLYAEFAWYCDVQGAPLPDGTVEFDGSDGKVPQTLDFYISMKQGTSFTFEIENYTSGSDADGRTHIADLAVASCRAEGKPFTFAEASKYPRFYEPLVTGLAPALPAMPCQQLFDLSGRRVKATGKLPSGIYIRNGQKVVR